MSEKKIKNAMMTPSFWDIYMGVSLNGGTPKWMVKIMENPIKMDDLGGPLVSETLISHTPLFRVSGCLGEAHEIELQPGNKQAWGGRPFDTVLYLKGRCKI